MAGGSVTKGALPAAAPTPAPALSPRARRRPSALGTLLRDPAGLVALVVVAGVVLAALLAPWIAPGDPLAGDLANTLKPPGDGSLLGTDVQGRDMTTRLLFGLRTTLAMALAAVVIGCGLGGVIGFAAAYYPRLSGPLMRLMDVLLSFPAILFGLALTAVLGPGLKAVVVALSIATIPLMARVARGAALVVLRQDYIDAARALGLRDRRILLEYVLPNALSPIFVFVTLRFGQVILLGALLSFIGLGAQPPTPELGSMASDGRSFLFFAPHVPVLPSLVIFVVVLALNVLGDALRDALDPKMRR
jgi:peptide/nickel transport system permease protein